MKNLYLLLFFILSHATVQAKIEVYNNPINILCIEEEKTGFDWIDNKWLKRNFIEEKFLVKKLRPSETVSGCSQKEDPNFQDNYFNGQEVSFAKACYEIKNFGDRSRKRKGKYFGRACEETWTKEESSKQVLLESVRCSETLFHPEIKLAPNGWFHKSRIEASLSDKAEEKSSLIISVGRCSIL